MTTDCSEQTAVSLSCLPHRTQNISRYCSLIYIYDPFDVTPRLRAAKVASLLREKEREGDRRSFPYSLSGGHACPRPAPRASSPRRLSRLFFTSKFPKPARQSTGDRTADVPPTMSSWALALHKRGNSKNGRERAEGGFYYDCEAPRYISKVPRAARADLTMHTLRCAPCFSTALPLATFLLSLHLAHLRLVLSFIPGGLLSSSFPAGSRSPFAPLPRGAKYRRTDRRIILSAT